MATKTITLKNPHRADGTSLDGVYTSQTLYYAAPSNATLSNVTISKVTASGKQKSRDASGGIRCVVRGFNRAFHFTINQNNYNSTYVEFSKKCYAYVSGDSEIIDDTFASVTSGSNGITLAKNFNRDSDIGVDFSGAITLTIEYTDTPIEEEITNCSAPNSFVMSGDGSYFTISGGAGGTRNAFSYYQVQYASIGIGGGWRSYGNVGQGGAVYLSTFMGNDYKDCTTTFQARTVGAAGEGYASSWVPISNITVYGPTANGAPTSVIVTPGTTTPNGAATLTFSGASAGRHGSVSGYQIWRSGSPSSGYSLLSVVSGAATVYAPSSPNTTYYYKVVAVSSRGDALNSPMSTVYGSLTAVYGRAVAPTSISVRPTMTHPGGVVRITFSGARAGEYASIAGYALYRSAHGANSYTNVMEFASAATSGEFVFTAPGVGSYDYKIVTKSNYGSAYDSPISSTLATLTVANEPTFAGGMGKTNSVVK